MAAADYIDTVQKVYIAYYGRPADPAGLAYWADQLNSVGGNLNSIVDAFGNSAEATVRFDGLSNADLINALYQSLFNRDADAAGSDYYSGLLTSGEATLANIMLRILDGATSGADADFVANKLVAAKAFTAAIDTPVEELAYAGSAAAASASSWLATVTNDDASVTAAEAKISDALAGMGAGGATFTLTTSTTALDVIAGTTGNDTFSGSAANSLNSGDTIIDAYTNDHDVLNAVITKDVDATTTIKNVETINVDFKGFGVNLDATKISGGKIVATTSQAGNTTAEVDVVKGITVEASTGIKTLVVTDISKNAVVDAGAATKLTLDADTGAAADDQVATVKVNGGKTTVELTAGGDAFGGLTIQSEGAANTVTLSDALATTTMTVEGTQDLTLKVAAADISGVELTNNLEGALVVDITSTSGNDDLSALDVAKFVVSGATATNVLTFASGTTVEMAQANNVVLNSKSTGSTDSITVVATKGDINIDTDTATNEFNTIYLSNAYTAAITATVDAGTANVLKLTGEGDITLANTSQAKSLDASAMTGALTATLDATNMKNVTGGSGDDYFYYTQNQAVTVNGGDGADVVEISANGAKGGGVANASITSLSFSNVETFKALDDINAKASQLSGKVLSFTADGTGYQINVTTLDSATVDLSSLTLDTTKYDGSSAVGAADVVVNASGQSIAMTISGANAQDSITGGSGNDTLAGNDGADILIGGAGKDSIDGGAGADVITGGTGVDQLTGGAGGDTFIFAGGDSVLTGYDTITDFQATSSNNDKLSFGGAGNVTDNILAAGAVDVHAADADATAVSINATVTKGKIALSGTDAAKIDTLAEWVAVASAVIGDGADAADNAVLFVFDGATYVYSEENTADLVQLVGTSYNLTDGAATSGSIVLL